MLDRLHKMATGRNIAILLVLDVIMMMGVMPFVTGRMKALIGNARLLDVVIPTYSPSFAHEMVTAYGAEGRALYRIFALSADLIYPLIYGFAFALLLAYLWPRLATGVRWLRFLPLIPLTAMLFDIGENLSVVTMITQYPVQSYGMARLAGFCSLMKWILVFLTLVLMLTGLNGLLIRWLQSR